jgi:hypothetical protein
MPKPPLPPDLVPSLTEPNPSVIATIPPDGSPHTAARSYLWVDIGWLSENYTGPAYPERDRGPVSVWIEVTPWPAWAVIEAWTGGRDRGVR